MYPIQCAGGYPFPIKKGMRSIVGVLAAVSDTTAASRIALIDSEDDKIVADGQDVKPYICDLKGLANSDGTIGVMFSEPVKVTKGVALSGLSVNLLPGKIFVYQK